MHTWTVSPAEWWASENLLVLMTICSFCLFWNHWYPMCSAHPFLSKWYYCQVIRFCLHLSYLLAKLYSYTLSTLGYHCVSMWQKHLRINVPTVKGPSSSCVHSWRIRSNMTAHIPPPTSLPSVIYLKCECSSSTVWSNIVCLHLYICCLICN